MVDQLQELEVIQTTQEMGVKERPEDDLYQGLYNWLRTDFRSKMGELLSKKVSEKRDVELANLQKEFAKVMYIFGQDIDVARRWERRLTEALLGDDPKSVVNVLGEEGKLEVKNHLIGSISALTLIDLIKKSKPELTGKMQLSEVFAEGERDVRNKVDMVLDFGTRTGSGIPILRLVQLKSVPENNSYISPIDPEHIKNDYFGKVSYNDALKLSSYAGMLEESRGVKAKGFVVLVPRYDSEGINNIFGIVRTDRPEGKILLEDFIQEATTTGLLPK